MSRIHDQLSESSGAQPPRVSPPRPVAPPSPPPPPPPPPPPAPRLPEQTQLFDPPVERRPSVVQHPGHQRGRPLRPALRTSTDLDSPPIGGWKAIAAFLVIGGVLMAWTAHSILTDKDEHPRSKPVRAKHETAPVAAAPAPVAPQPAPAAPPVEIARVVVEPEPVAPVAAPAPTPLPVIEVPGTHASRVDDGISIVFDYGAFARVDQLRPEGRAALVELAGKAGPLMDRATIIVTGFTDNDPVPANRPYKTNVELGMMRAVAASKVLIEAGLPPDRVSTRSLGDKQTPYPNDSSENKARNRTVIVSIRPQ